MLESPASRPDSVAQGPLESFGFAEAWVLRRHRFVDGEHCDLIQYVLLRSDWRDRS